MESGSAKGHATFVILMGIGLTGINGVNVQQPVDRDNKSASDVVIIHHLHLVVNAVEEVGRKYNNVMMDPARPMGAGVLGAHGMNVLSLVVMEYNTEQECVPILHQQMEAKIVKDTVKKDRHAIVDHVQSMEAGVTGVTGVIVLYLVVMEHKIE